MADPPATQQTGSTFGFLGRKVGPFPIIIWGAIAFGAWYWYSHYGPGASKTTATTGTPGGPTVIEVRGRQGRPGVPGPAAPEDKDVTNRKRHGVTDRKPGTNPPVPQPVAAAAPMTAGGIYGDAPVATPQGTFYDSGQPLEGQYVPAG